MFSTLLTLIGLFVKSTAFGSNYRYTTAPFDIIMAGRSKSCADSWAMKRSRRQVANNGRIGENDMLEQELREYLTKYFDEV